MRVYFRVGPDYLPSTVSKNAPLPGEHWVNNGFTMQDREGSLPVDVYWFSRSTMYNKRDKMVRSDLITGTALVFTQKPSDSLWEPSDFAALDSATRFFSDSREMEDWEFNSFSCMQRRIQRVYGSEVFRISDSVHTYQVYHGDDKFDVEMTEYLDRLMKISEIIYSKIEAASIYFIQDKRNLTLTICLEKVCMFNALEASPEELRSQFDFLHELCDLIDLRQ